MRIDFFLKQKYEFHISFMMIYMIETLFRVHGLCKITCQVILN